MSLTPRRAPYVFLAPAAAFYALFFLGSTLFALLVSFKDWNMLTPPLRAEWVGLENYRTLLAADPLFWLTLRNTLLFGLGVVAGATMLGLVIAFLLARTPGKVVWRTIYYLPMVTSVVVVANIWLFIFNPKFGLLNTLLDLVGLSGPSWLYAPGLALWALVLVGVWWSLGHTILFYSAGLEGIPRELYEAARADGAGLWQEFVHITVPLLRPTTLFVVITNFLVSLQQSFALVLIMTQGGPLDSTRVLPLYMFETAFKFFHAGTASAMVFVFFLVSLGFALISLRLFRVGGVEAY